MLPTRSNMAMVSNLVNSWAVIRKLLTDATSLLEAHLMDAKGAHEALSSIASRVSTCIAEDALAEAYDSLWCIASRYTGIPAVFWFRMAEAGVKMVELVKE